MVGITHIGDTPSVIAICLFLIILPKSGRTVALPVSTAVILSGTVNLLLKNLFARERPDMLRLINETNYSFPSGHAMINASLYTILLFLSLKFILSKPVLIPLSILCAALPVAIGYSRVYVGVHYAGDVIGGWLIGIAIAGFVYLIWDNRFSKEKDEDKSLKTQADKTA